MWKEFVRRFGRIKIREGYGLTEASIGFLNYTDEVGPIGRASYFNKVRNKTFNDISSGLGDSFITIAYAQNGA